MIVLGIETCSPNGGVALYDGDCLLGVQTIHSSRAHSRMILPAVERMLGELNLKVADLGAVAVSEGPGSFTGVRVGLTIGKALCASGTPPLVLVSTLEAFARHMPAGENAQYVMPLLNARRGELYGARWKLDGGRLGECDAEPFAASPEEVAEQIPPGTLIAGEGVRAYREVWEQLPPGRVLLARPDRSDPSPATVAVLGRERAIEGKFADPATAAPLYLRGATTSAPRVAPRPEPFRDA